VGEDAKDRVEGIKSLMEKYKISPDEIVFIDDKPTPINEISENMKDITTVKIEFEDILKLAWAEKCLPTFKIKIISDLRKIADGKSL